jgi:hypothetical protein
MPRYDFCFFGSLTPRREQVIADVLRRGHTVDVIPHGATLAERDARVPLSRAVLDIKQYHWWDLVSSVRYVTALNCRRPVIAEARSAEARERWESVVRFAPAGMFVAVAAHSVKDWKALYEQQAVALRRKSTMIEAAVAVLPPPGTRARSTPIMPPQLMPIIIQPPSPIPTKAPILVGVFEQINIVQLGDKVYAIPQRVGCIHIDRVDLTRFPMIKSFPDLARARLEIARGAVR